VEALKAGRIDPWIYELDSKSGTLRLNESMRLAKTVNSALKRVNEDQYAAKMLASAYGELTKPGQYSVCTPTVYAAKIKEESDQTGGQWFTWEFVGDRQPSDVQMVACFQALYGKVPKGCDIASYAEVAAKCMVRRSGFVDQGACLPGADAAAATGAKNVSAAAKKPCCKHCSGLYYSPSCGGNCP
jgi:hypothetical protein